MNIKEMQKQKASQGESPTNTRTSDEHRDVTAVPIHTKRIPLYKTMTFKKYTL